MHKMLRSYNVGIRTHQIHGNLQLLIARRLARPKSIRYMYMNLGRGRPSSDELFVQFLLSSLALILASLVLGHVLGHDRARVGFVCRCLGIVAVLDGLDRELLLRLGLYSQLLAVLSNILSPVVPAARQSRGPLLGI